MGFQNCATGLDLGFYVASSLGARMIAAASSQAKRAAAINARAEVAVDYEIEDLKARVREFTGAGAHLVVDPVGDPFAEPALRSLRGLGRYLVVGFAGGSIPWLPLNHVLLENRTVIGVDWGAWSRRIRRATRHSWPICSTAWRLGVCTCRPHDVPTQRAAEALNRLARRRVAGKLALLP